MDNKKPKNITEAIRHLEALTNEHAGNVGKEVENIMNDVKKTLEDLRPLVDDIESKARVKIKETAKKVKQDPWIIVIAVAIVGFILGLLIFKNRED